MNLLDGLNLALKSTDFKISPLLQGNSDYQKWQQSNNAAGKSQNTKITRQEGDDDDE